MPETSPSYTLTIIAINPHGLTSQEQVTVSDTAVFVPVFGSSASWAVAENASAGTDLGSVAASDPDGGTLSYAVSGGPFTLFVRRTTC